MSGVTHQALLMVGGVYVSPAGFSAWGAATTWDPATIANVTLSGGNLVNTNTGGSSFDQGARVAIGKTTGKWYFELTFTNLVDPAPFSQNEVLGVAMTSAAYTNVGGSGTNAAVFNYQGNFSVNGSSVGTGVGTRADGDVIGFAVDLDASPRRFWARVAPSGLWNGTVGANPATNTSGASLVALTGALAPICTHGGPGGFSGNITTANFGATAFTGAIP